MLVLKHSMRLFPFSWRGNMHFRKANLLLFQLRYSLLSLCKYLVRNKFVNNLGQFLWFWGFILFQSDYLDVSPIIWGIFYLEMFPCNSTSIKLRLFQSQKFSDNLSKLYAIFLAWFKIHGVLKAKFFLQSLFCPLSNEI